MRVVGCQYLWPTSSAPRPGGGIGGSVGSEESPFDPHAVGAVVEDAQASAGPDPVEQVDDMARAGIERYGPHQQIQSDADPMRHGAFSVGGRMTHIRPMTGPTGGSTGTYAASDLGDG
jgi:hypothetical protein